MRQRLHKIWQKETVLKDMERSKSDGEDGTPEMCVNVDCEQAQN